MRKENPIKFEPKWAIAPGEHIMDWLREAECEHLSFKNVREALNFNREEMDAFLVGDIAIDQNLAMKLEKLFGPPVNFFINLDKNYRKNLENG